nr:MAG TPA: hypothetical protein [Caudoviricetes sp.]DAR46765.1 MAG TPA: hypothetical protein [Caudoviricetes sp.]
MCRQIVDKRRPRRKSLHVKRGPPARTALSYRLQDFVTTCMSS